MRLRQVRLKNFRGYREEQTLDIENNITAIVGKNDSGKSSMLEALEIFFECATLDIEDLNVDCEDDKEIIISCVFDDLPETITVDATADTTLQREYMTNKNGHLEIVKAYKCTDKSVDKEPAIYLRSLHPTLKGYDDLLTLKIEELKNRAGELGVRSSDDRISGEIRKTIWENADDLLIQEVSLSVTSLSEKFQSVYKNLEKQFPEFFIFKVDRQTVDSDAEAKDPIQVAVKEAKKQFDKEIQELEDKIVERVKEVTERALVKLREMDPNLAEKLTPTFKKRPTWTFDFKIQDHRGVPLNKRGSGTRRLVLLNFFRAEAERKSGSGDKNIIYAVEEPETSQHPSNQNIIIKSLLALADDSKRQVLVSTHSSELLEELPREAIRYVSITNGDPSVINGEQGLILAADSLGRLSAQRFGSAKKLVLVEGIPDCIFLEHAAKTLKQAGKISKNFTDVGVLALPLGGTPGIKKWIQYNKADTLGLKYYILLDSDRTSSSQTETDNETYCKQLITDGHKAHVTRKREIENYIDPSVASSQFSDFDDAKIIICQNNNIGQSKVIETYWITMTAEQIVSMSMYRNSSGEDCCEVLNLIEEIINL